MIAMVPLLLLAAMAQDKSSTDVKEPALRAELLKRMKAEQDIRFELMKENPTNKSLRPTGQASPEIKAVLEKMEAIDKDNLAWFKTVVKEKGWPGKAMVGPDGAQGAFLIAQHAVSDLNFMADCHKKLIEAHKAGDAEGQWVALMTDWLLVLKDKKKQLYGSQLESKDGKLVPQPIEDEAHVDERRKALGMPPLADYLKMVNEGRGARPAPKADAAEKAPGR